MGPLGTQELIFIFFLALLLFGPKKLPELGRTIGKAMTEFRRAQSELKASFDREMKNLERETGINELAATTYQSGSYDYENSAYEPSYYGDSHVSTLNPTAEEYAVPALPAGESSANSTVTTYTANGASATQGAGSTTALRPEPAAGSIASGQLLAYAETPVEHAPGTVSPAVHDAVHG